MKCRECVEQLYPYLDKELTPPVETEVRAHLEHCHPCHDQFEFEALFLRFLHARTRAQGAPPELKEKIVRELLEE
jgi:mycothiol system anti-sigma-R factor